MIFMAPSNPNHSMILWSPNWSSSKNDFLDLRVTVSYSKKGGRIVDWFEIKKNTEVSAVIWLDFFTKAF